MPAGSRWGLARSGDGSTPRQPSAQREPAIAQKIPQHFPARQRRLVTYAQSRLLGPVGDPHFLLNLEVTYALIVSRKQRGVGRRVALPMQDDVLRKARLHIGPNARIGNPDRHAEDDESLVGQGKFVGDPGRVVAHRADVAAAEAKRFRRDDCVLSREGSIGDREDEGFDVVQRDSRMPALIADRAQAREVGDETEEKRRLDDMPLIGGERALRAGSSTAMTLHA